MRPWVVRRLSARRRLSFGLLGVASIDDLDLDLDLDLEAMQALSAMWANAGIEAKIESIKKESIPPQT